MQLCQCYSNAIKMSDLRNLTFVYKHLSCLSTTIFQMPRNIQLFIL